MEQKAKWVYIGESTEWFVKGKIYAEDKTATYDNETLRKAYDEGNCKIIIGERGHRTLFVNRAWTKEFYKL